MEADHARELILRQKHAEESSKGDTSNFTVAGEIFATLAGGEDEPRMTLKCEPDFALALREGHNAIRPGEGQDSKHWNTLYLHGGLSDAVVADLVNQSYKLVTDELPEETRSELGLDEEEEES